MTEYAGRGDPRRSLELLWGLAEPRTRGPKPRLGLADVVHAAIALADDTGLAAVSMRAVADRLAMSTMSLYTYLPGKAELLDLMHDTVLGELPTDYAPQAATGGWRAAMEAFVGDLWALYERHPWMLRVSPARASFGPHSFDVLETQVRILDGTGLTGAEMARLAGAIHTFVAGAAQAVADARDAAHATGVTEDEWWEARAPIVDEIARRTDWPARFPMLTRLEAEGVFDQLDRAPDDPTGYMERDALDAFELGLACLLDGVDRLVTSRTP